MKRLAIVASAAALGIAGAALLSGSIAGAAAQNVFVGSCGFHGTSTFDPPYLKGSPQQVGYHFKTTDPPAGDSADNTCTGTLNGKQGTYKVSAYVDGGTNDGDQLSCAASSAKGATGAIVFVDSGIVFPMKLDINGGATEVQLDAYDAAGDHSYGEASFRDYTDNDPSSPTFTPAQCNGDGVKSLDFDATFPNSNDTLKADKPATSGTTDTGTGPSETQQTQTQPDQGGVKGYRKSSSKSKGLKCGKGHKKHTKAQGKKCAKRGKGKKKGHSK